MYCQYYTVYNLIIWRNGDVHCTVVGSPYKAQGCGGAALCFRAGGEHINARDTVPFNFFVYI